MRGPGRPLLLGLLFVLGAAGPGRGLAEPREAADRQTLLRLIVEIIQELKKYHSGEPKRPPPSGQQHYAPGRAEAADHRLYPEEQRAGECATRGGPRARLLGNGIAWRKHIFKRQIHFDGSKNTRKKFFFKRRT